MDVQTQFFTYGVDDSDKLNLSNGLSFGPITLAYETYGNLNSGKSNAILVFHALSGSQHVTGYNSSVTSVGDKWTNECKTGWWNDFVGSKKIIDTDKFFVICINYFGGCYGTTGPSSTCPKTNNPYGGTFPKFTFGDIVDSQIPLYDHLGIKKFKAVIGSSLGGMMALNFSTRYPDKVEKIIAIACGIRSPILTKTHNLEQIMSIENDANFNNGNYYTSLPPNKGLTLARMISHKTFVSLKYIKSRMKNICEQKDDDFSWFKIKTPLESYLLHQGNKFSKRFDANTYIYLIAAWSDFDLKNDHKAKEDYEIFKNCSNHEYLIFSINSDCCFYPEEQEELNNALQKAKINSKYIVVNSEKGHDSFLLEPNLYSKEIKGILNK